jgi:extracellular factor (EF) 3-hydroxypalmitic acid methyl ester biosynthesis protein
MEYLLEWHLIYRTPLQLQGLIPDRAPPRSFILKTDDTGINVFIEVRKPDDA